MTLYPCFVWMVTVKLNVYLLWSAFINEVQVYNTAFEYHRLTSFFMPPFCLTILLALLNLATLAMVSAARHLRPRTGERSISTSIGRPTHIK